MRTLKNSLKMFHVKHSGKFFRFFVVSRETLNANFYEWCYLKISSRRNKGRYGPRKGFGSVFFWVNSLIQHTSLPDFPRFGSLICFFRKIAEKKAVFVIFEPFFACADGHFPGEKTVKSPRKTLFADEKTLLRCLRAILYLFISEFPGKKP